MIVRCVCVYVCVCVFSALGHALEVCDSEDAASVGLFDLLCPSVTRNVTTIRCAKVHLNQLQYWRRRMQA